MILWKAENPVQVTVHLNLPEFSLVKYQTTNVSQKTSSGEYSAINLDLVFERETGPYLLKVFIPITMLVIVSWLGFFIKVNEQFLKSIISLLVLITLVIALTVMNKELPRVSYTKALDVWTGTCVTFIFAALVESVLVYLCSRSCDKKTESDHLNDSVDKNVSINDSNQNCSLKRRLTNHVSLRSWLWMRRVAN